MPGQVWHPCQAIGCDRRGLRRGGLWIGEDVMPKEGHPPAPGPDPSTHCPSLCVPKTHFYFIPLSLTIDF